jgi:ubiquitin carboxyl-terminal hydrolase L5
MAIENSDVIRNAHNSFARQEPFIFEQEREATEKDDVFHFVSYLPFQNKLYELDGIQKGPVLIGIILNHLFNKHL